MTDRGRDAEHPAEIPTPGWRDVWARLKEELAKDQIGLASAGVAYYGLLAIFPALAVATSSYALWGNPADLVAQLESFGLVPDEARKVLLSRLTEAARTEGPAGFGLIASLAVGLWGANRGAQALMSALNLVYDESERRGFFARTGVSLVLTATALAIGLLGLTVILAVPNLLNVLGLSALESMAALVLPWIVLSLGLILALAVVYRFGPARRDAHWVWVTPGAVVAAALWIGGSIGFSVYVSHFARFGEVYGSVGAVVVLLMWLYLSAYSALLGAELNSEIEHQTARDSTVGEDRPMGERDAQVADTLGRER